MSWNSGDILAHNSVQENIEIQINKDKIEVISINSSSEVRPR